MQRSPLTRLTDNNKRWIVFGIALNHALVPSIRPTFEQEIYNGYKNLLVKHGINVQTSHKFPSQYQESEMHYENINGNSKRPFNYKVTSHVDFGKLFLNGYMAQFNAFDETCDASAVLSMLGKIPIFPAALKSAADAVRSRRNYWAHCNFEEWTDEYFNGSFDAMDVLVKSFPTFPMEDLTNVLKDLTKWKEKGVQLCMGDTIDQELLKLVEDHVKQLSNNFKYMVFEHQAEKKMFYDNLFACSQRLDKLKHEHGKRLEELEMNVQDLQRQQISTAAKVDQFEMGNILLDKLLLVSEGLENSRRKAAVESNPGGYFDFNVITQRVQVVRDICVTAVSLGAIYAGYHLLRPLILYAVTTACGGERDDQQICDFKKGSLIVVLHCFTDERFLEFLQDYQSGRFLERLQKELSEINFKVKGMEVQILNDNEVCQTKEAIKKRMHSGLKTSLDIKTSKEEVKVRLIRCYPAVTHRDVNNYVGACPYFCENCRRVMQLARLLVTDLPQYFRKDLEITCYGDHVSYRFYSGSGRNEIVVQMNDGDLVIHVLRRSWLTFVQGALKQCWSKMVGVLFSVVEKVSHKSFKTSVPAFAIPGPELGNLDAIDDQLYKIIC